MPYNPYMNQGAFRAPASSLAVGYHQQFNPQLAEEHQQEILQDANRFERGYQGSQEFLEKVGEIPIRANQDDAAWVSKHLENTKNNLYGLVKDRYNGDWGAAAPELSSKMVEESTKWNKIKQISDAQKQIDDQTGALERQGKLILPDALDKNGNIIINPNTGMPIKIDPRKQSIFDGNGKPSLPTGGVYQKGDWEGYVEKNLSKALNESDEYHQFMNKYGYIVDQKNGGINPSAWAELNDPKKHPDLYRKINDFTKQFVDANREYAVTTVVF